MKYKLKAKKVYSIDEFNSLLEQTRYYPEIDFDKMKSWKQAPPLCRQVKVGGFWIDLTINSFGDKHRYQLRMVPKEAIKDGELTGSQAFKIFKEQCLKYGINLDDYIIYNGKEVKLTIPSYLIKADPGSLDYVFEGANHIDFHSSFPAGLANTHPEFRPLLEELYNKRKENAVYKAILNLTIGYMQSITCCDAKWAHLSKDAITDNNNRIKELTQKLLMNGNIILAYNTDGIWYTGNVYHGEGEGSTLGAWENDHINCKIRFKSAGAYEYIENGIYTPVVRGLTTFDIEKPDRETWEWGDIYKGSAIEYVYLKNENRVIAKHVEEIKDGKFKHTL